MRWIKDDVVAKQLLLEAKTCRYIDSRRESTVLEVLSFDDAAICTREFARLVQELLALSSDNAAHFIVLDPDPVAYLHRHFGKYPILSLREVIQRKRTSLYSMKTPAVVRQTQLGQIAMSG